MMLGIKVKLVEVVDGGMYACFEERREGPLGPIIPILRGRYSTDGSFLDWRARSFYHDSLLTTPSRCRWYRSYSVHQVCKSTAEYWVVTNIGFAVPEEGVYVFSSRHVVPCRLVSSCFGLCCLVGFCFVLFCFVSFRFVLFRYVSSFSYCHAGKVTSLCSPSWETHARVKGFGLGEGSL